MGDRPSGRNAATGRSARSAQDEPRQGNAWCKISPDLTEDPMPRTRIAHTMGDLQLFAQTITPETTAEHPFLEYAHAKLKRFIEEIDQLGVERDFHAARKLEATRRRNEMIEEGAVRPSLTECPVK